MDFTHHANLYFSATPSLAKIVFSDDYEVVDQFFEKMGIDDVRTLTMTASTLPQSGSLKKLVVRAGFITEEAQNALLKLLEEPRNGCEFDFILPNGFIFLPTLLSRFSKQDSNEDLLITDVFKAFINSTIKNRITQIDERLKKKDIEWQQGIKNGLLAYIRYDSRGKPENLKSIEMISRLLLTRGASNKMLLEHLALSL